MSSIAPVGRADRYRLLALFFVAFAIRLTAVAVWTGLNADPCPGSDEAEYDTIAWNLARGEGYRGISPDVVAEDGSLREHPTAYRPPVAPLFYAAVYTLAGHSYAAAHVADSLLASLSVVLVFLITRRLFDRGAAWLAAGVYALYPVAVYYNLTLLSETQGAFLVSMFAWLTLALKDRGGARWAVAAGSALGALLLCKPGFVFLIPLLPVWAWAVCRRDLALWGRAALIPATAGLMVLPWAARNYAEFGAFVPFSTGGGSLLLQANNRIVVADPKYHGYAVWDTSLPEYAPALRAANDEVERDAVAKRLAVQWLRDNPDKWFYLARGKFWRLWTPAYVGSGNQELAWVLYAYYGTILVVFAVAVLPVGVRLWRRRDPGLILLALILATVATALVFHGQHRYRFPIDSLCIVIAAGGVSWLARAAHRPRARELFAWRGARWLAIWVGVGVAVLVGGIVAVRMDDERIDTYRAELAEHRLSTIEAAVTAFPANTGRAPERLVHLVPAIPPNAEDVQC